MALRYVKLTTMFQFFSYFAIYDYSFISNIYKCLSGTNQLFDPLLYYEIPNGKQGFQTDLYHLENCNFF